MVRFSGPRESTLLAGPIGAISSVRFLLRFSRPSQISALIPTKQESASESSRAAAAGCAEAAGRASRTILEKLLIFLGKYAGRGFAPVELPGMPMGIKIKCTYGCNRDTHLGAP